MKKIYVAFNVLLVILILICCFFKSNSTLVSYQSVVKTIPTNRFTEGNDNISFKRVDGTAPIFHRVLGNTIQNMSRNLVGASIITDVLETQYGTMSAYGLDCDGCSGVVGARYDAAGNNLIYHDPTYGDLRIVAGDKKYPYGTVVRVVNSKIGTFGVIVLDRGGDIGIGRRYLFDLLFYTEAEAYEFGLSRNTTFEVLRYGY